MVKTYPGQVKLNVDRSSLGNLGKARCSGLFRDHDGAWLFGFACHIGFATNLQAKLWGIREASFLPKIKACSGSS